MHEMNQINKTKWIKTVKCVNNVVCTKNYDANRVDMFVFIFDGENKQPIMWSLSKTAILWMKNKYDFSENNTGQSKRTKRKKSSTGTECVCVFFPENSHTSVWFMICDDFSLGFPYWFFVAAALVWSVCITFICESKWMQMTLFWIIQTSRCFLCFNSVDFNMS